MNFGVIFQDIHQDVLSDLNFEIFDTIFVKCTNNKGGAIYIKVPEGSVIVSSCSFYKCAASGSSSRGSAVMTEETESDYYKNCNICSCTSDYGGDIQSNSQSVELNHILSNCNSMQYHSTFLNCQHINIKYSNWSSNSLQNTCSPFIYGNILGLATATDINIEYIIGIKCSCQAGQKALISYETIINEKSLISHVNMIENSGHQFIISFLNAESENIIVENSNFIDHIEIQNYHSIDINSDVKIEYKSCSFSYDIPSDLSSFETNSCQFSRTLISDIYFNEECYLYMHFNDDKFSIQTINQQATKQFHQLYIYIFIINNLK